MVSSFDKATTPSQVEEVIASFPTLSELEQDMLVAKITKATEMNRAAINKRLKVSEGGSHDHLQLARRLVGDMGRDNVISLKSLTYKWSARGVWEVWEDRGLKQYTQTKIEEYGENVTAQLINSVTAVFNNELYVEGHRFNVGPADVVNCMNGEFNVMDCSDQAFGQHVREHYRTAQVPIEYDPDAKAPRFEQFLDEIFEGDDDSVAKRWALLQMMGYTLMAHCKYEKFIILLGTGANGKSVLLAVLEALCGIKNTAAVQPNEIGNKFQRANLNEKLVNIVTEIKQGAQIDDAALKAIVSGEVCTVEQKGKDPFEMRPFATCWFGTNHMPHTRDFSDALFRRALILTFNNRFSQELGNCNHDLKDELIAELPGILNMVTEAYGWVELTGFITPKSSLAAAKAWRIEADQVAQFVEECTELDSGNEIRIGDLYGYFNQWADVAGVKSRVTKKSFRQRLSTMGFGMSRSSHGRLIKGLKMLEGAMVEIEIERANFRSH
jgi:putative DNA primase/helicase